MTPELENWFKEYGDFPLIQVMMHPDLVRLVNLYLVALGVELQPLDLGEGELPTLMTTTSTARFKQLMTGGLPERSADELPEQSADGPTVAELEELTGFRRHPVREDPPMP